MSTIRTEAWVLRRGSAEARPANRDEFTKTTFEFDDVTADEVLVEPLYGCWEGNMTHAINRDPIDVCRQRREDAIVLGNSGVVRVLRTGPEVTRLREGDIALVAPIGVTDRFGYVTKVVAYDAPNTMGLLAKQTKFREWQLGVVPIDEHHTIRQWAAFSLRYMTAWANWNVAYGCWRVQMPENRIPTAHVCAWGGGVGLAEVTLAKHFGCEVSMVASTDERIRLLQSMGVRAIDRRQFPCLDFDPVRYEQDRQYKKSYLASESAFLKEVRDITNGEGVSVLVDNIGRPVFRASVRALARQGVLTTVGWKLGMDTSLMRASECIARHLHVFTHGASYDEGVAAVEFALRTGWMPPESDEVYDWDHIDELAEAFNTGAVTSYFPLYAINAAA